MIVKSHQSKRTIPHITIGLSGLITHSLGFSFGIVGSMILLLAGVL